MKAKKILCSSIMTGFATLASAFEMPNTIATESLSQNLANMAVLTAVEDCTKRGYKVSAAMTGRDGNLMAFLRNPLSGPHTIEVSQRKAYSSATLQAPTSAMASRPDLSFAPGILLITGGVPVSVGGKFYGGIAVAGAEPDIDEKCAIAGVEAITEAIEFGGMQ